nr:immunoglobulin heavy chain junction region [Homo sapiens]
VHQHRLPAVEQPE